MLRFEPLGDYYQSSLNKAVEGGWIDVFENTGKRSGAYSANVYGVHPYMLMNYNETIRSVFTLAHELGHTMHTMLANENQPFATASYTIFVAEVASTFNERLLLDYLLERTEDRRLKDLSPLKRPFPKVVPSYAGVGQSPVRAVESRNSHRWCRPKRVRGLTSTLRFVQLHSVRLGSNSHRCAPPRLRAGANHNNLSVATDAICKGMRRNVDQLERAAEAIEDSGI